LCAPKITLRKKVIIDYSLLCLMNRIVVNGSHVDEFHLGKGLH